MENSDYDWFRANFEFIGRISNEDFLHNLSFIRKHIGEDTTLILINGCEIPHENDNKKNRLKSHIEMNKLVDKFVENNKNTYLIDVRKIVTSRSQLKDSILHYQREVYYLMATEISKVIEKAFGKSIKVTKYNKNKRLISIILEKVFSVKNGQINGAKYKIINILGFKLKIKKINTQ